MFTELNCWFPCFAQRLKRFIFISSISQSNLSIIYNKYHHLYNFGHELNSLYYFSLLCNWFVNSGCRQWQLGATSARIVLIRATNVQLIIPFLSTICLQGIEIKTIPALCCLICSAKNSTGKFNGEIPLYFYPQGI